MSVNNHERRQFVTVDSGLPEYDDQAGPISLTQHIERVALDGDIAIGQAIAMNDSRQARVALHDVAGALPVHVFLISSSEDGGTLIDEHPGPSGPLLFD